MDKQKLDAARKEVILKALSDVREKVEAGEVTTFMLFAKTETPKDESILQGMLLNDCPTDYMEAIGILSVAQHELNKALLRMRSKDHQDKLSADILDILVKKGIIKQKDREDEHH